MLALNWVSLFKGVICFEYTLSWNPTVICVLNLFAIILVMAEGQQRATVNYTEGGQAVAKRLKGMLEA